MEDHMGAPATTFWTYFALGASMRGHLGAKISKICAMICRGYQNTPKWCSQCFHGVRKWLQGYKDRATSLQWGPSIYTYTHVFTYDVLHTNVYIYIYVYLCVCMYKKNIYVP